MKKRLYKGLILTLAAALLAGTLSGCGGSKDTANEGPDISGLGDTGGIELPITDKNITLSAFVETTVSDLEDKFLLQNIKNITGIAIEPIVTNAANAAQKLQMLAASKQLPDFGVYCFNSSDRSSLAKNGALASINDYLDSMPNVKKIMETDEMFQKAVAYYAEDDGKTYMLPSKDIERYINHCMMYRKDIFDAAGIQPWTDQESFYQALKALKEKYPDSIPFSVKQQFAIIDYLRQQWGLITDCTPDSNGQYTFYMIHEQMRDMLTFLRKLYGEGLMDPEFLTTTQASWTAKMTNENKAFVTFDWVDRMDIFYESIKEQIPEYELTMGMPIGSTGKYLRMNGSGTNAMFITNNDNIDYTTKMVDFFMSEAGAHLTTLGLEGVTYEKEGDEVTYKGFEDTLPNTTDLQNEYALFIAGLSPRFDTESAYYMYTPQVEKAQQLAKDNDLMQDFEFSVNVSGAEDRDRYNEVTSELRKEFEIFASNYILGKSDADASWQEWVDTAKRLGIEDLQAIYTKYAK